MNITQQLSLPDTKLLKWSEEDESVHPEATQLGADLHRNSTRTYRLAIKSSKKFDIISFELAL